MFQFIPKLFSGVEIRTLKVFHSNFKNHVFMANHVFIYLNLDKGALSCQNMFGALVSLKGICNIKAYKSSNSVVCLQHCGKNVKKKLIFGSDGQMSTNVWLNFILLFW